MCLAVPGKILSIAPPAADAEAEAAAEQAVAEVAAAEPAAITSRLGQAAVGADNDLSFGHEALDPVDKTRSPMVAYRP